MAITSVGYSGTVDETEWAGMMAHAGAAAVVENAADLKVTTVSGQDRTVSVAEGTAHAHGVRAILSPAQTIQLTVPTTTRWDAICLRRNWTTNATTVVAVEGTTAQALPAGLEDTPGTLHDQPLALIQVTNGQQLPTANVDLRVWASKVLTIGSLLSLTGMPLGTEAVIGGLRYRRQLVSGVVTTVRVDPQIASGLYSASFVGVSVPSRTFSPALPAGRFLTAPQVIPSFKTTSGASGGLTVRVTATTTTNFTLVVYSRDGTDVAQGSYPVSWLAIASDPELGDI